MIPPTKLEAALKIAALGIGGVYPAWLKKDYTGDPDKATSRVYAPHKTRHHATTDAAILRQWWTGKPTDNPKIIIGPGHVVIDIDTPSGGHQDGTTNITQLGDLPTTYSETTPSGGKHLVYKLPTGTTFKNVLMPCAGIELLGEGATFIASGSTTPKGQYTDNGAAIVEAPPNIVALIEQLKPKPQTRPTPSTLPTATGEITEQMRQWANDILDENRQRLRTEPSGQRNRVARNIAFHTGTIAHLTGLSLDAIFELFAADIAHWGDVRNDENTIKRGLNEGAKNEFTPKKDEFTPYWAICVSIMRQLTAQTWDGKITIEGKTTRRKITDKATGELMRIDSPLAIRLADVGAALAAIAELVLTKIKPINAQFTISARQLAKLMLLSNVDTASWRLQALCQLGYLTQIKPATAGNKPTAPTYQITTKYVTDSDRQLAKSESLNMFECMQSRDTKINTNTNMAANSLPAIPISVTTLHRSKRSISVSMFYARPQSSRKLATTKHDSVNGVVSIGADGKPLDKHTPGVTMTTITSPSYGGLGSPNRIISEHLKKCDLFPSQIAELTGLSLDTVRRSLHVMVNDGVVNRGDGRKNKPYSWRGLDTVEHGEFNTTVSERLICEFRIRERLANIEAKNIIVRQKYASRFERTSTTATATEPPVVTAVTIASDDERKPTPAPTTINIVAAWLAKLADIAEDVQAGNPYWIPKREIPASEFDAVRNVATGYKIKLIDANLSYYQARAA